MNTLRSLSSLRYLKAPLTCAVAFAVAAQAAAQISRDEALASAFPAAQIRPEQVFLTLAQLREVRTRAGLDVESALVARYIATFDGKVVGRAYVDTHMVRTKRESLLVSLDESGRVKRIDVTAFLEPTEYRASELWLRQYTGKAVGDDVAVNRAIRPLAGATLTARAVNSAVRRVLAIDDVLRGEQAR